MEPGVGTHAVHLHRGGAAPADHQQALAKGAGSDAGALSAAAASLSAHDGPTLGVNGSLAGVSAGAMSASGGSVPSVANPGVLGGFSSFAGFKFIRNSITLQQKAEGRTVLEQEASDLTRTAFWVGFGLLLGLGVWLIEDHDSALQYWTCYIIEQSLSVDNLFVFLLIFRFFKVPRDSQEVVLYWGIVGACVFRGLMIVLGEALVHRFTWISLIFSVILLYSAFMLLFGADSDDDDPDSMANNSVVTFVRRVVPVADRYHGRKFFVYENGRLVGTPLLLVLLCIELSDVIFAMDSVPAVLGLSDKTLVVYTSNMAAILGLRSLYFVIADAIQNMRFLKHSLSIMLSFVGIKIVLDFFGFHISTLLSLLFILLVLACGVTASMLLPLKQRNEDASEAADVEMGSDIPQNLGRRAE
ncbi:Thylakoid membrane protein TERC, chloroplastic [Porphyridium purpureum]|uniref:Thylakoid membrane protein TERC, chloroplastic n=1 Tax=Porphyridium purpureum TaxID=35688 RepID=A0A5J4YSR0_PORPP|nr:Thylakoid membrane protein TERC, chloroplastic [Porphyridium purpureum]|eukprot:POR7503..scf229_5